MEDRGERQGTRWRRGGRRKTGVTSVVSGAGEDSSGHAALGGVYGMMVEAEGRGVR